MDGSSGAVDAAVVGLADERVRAAAHAYFGERLPLAEQYASMLATDGVVRGLIGPREAPRIWERHLLNCVAVAELIPAASSGTLTGDSAAASSSSSGAIGRHGGRDAGRVRRRAGGEGRGTGVRVIDAGSGAGLPGIVLALARPDLDVTLVEPKLRATTFLTEVVTELGIDGRVTVVRARAEECHGRLPAVEVVTARALAPLDRLAGWCLPLARIGGTVLALKGESAEDEVAAHAAAVRRRGGGYLAVRRCGVDHLTHPTIVVEMRRERQV